MNLSKKLKKGISVLLAASMIVGMAVDSPAARASASASPETVQQTSDEQESTGGQATSQNETSADDNAPTQDSTNTDTGLSDNDISNKTAINLFRTTKDVKAGDTVQFKGNEDTVKIDSRIMNIEKNDGNNYFDLSVVINASSESDFNLSAANALQTWGQACSNNISAKYTGTPLSVINNTSDAADASAGTGDIYFANANTGSLLTLDDYNTYKNNLDKIIGAADNSSYDYWLGTQVLGENGSPYSVAAYVKQEASGSDDNTNPTQKVDLANKTDTKRVFVKAKADKVKYIFGQSDLAQTSEWKDTPATDANTSFNLFYEGTAQTTGGIVLKKWNNNDKAATTIVDPWSESSDDASELVGGTQMELSVPTVTDKVLLALMKENNTATTVKWSVIQPTEGTATATVSVPNDLVGECYLKAIAVDNTGLIKDEQDYHVNIVESQELSVGLEGAGENNSIETTLDYKDQKTDGGDSITKATNTIALNVTKSNTYPNPSKDDFCVTYEKIDYNNQSNTVLNQMTTLSIDSYDEDANVLTVSSEVEFTAAKMQAFANERTAYLYYKNKKSDADVLTYVGAINLKRQYVSEFAYDNEGKNQYTYGEEDIPMDIVGGHLPGVYDLLKSIYPDASTISVTTTDNTADTTADAKEDEILRATRYGTEEGDTTEFSYKENDGAETIRVATPIDAGSYKTVSKEVVASVSITDNNNNTDNNTDNNTSVEFASDSQISTSQCTLNIGQSDGVFQFKVRNTTDRTFNIAKKKITLKPDNQTRPSGLGIASSPLYVKITDTDTEEKINSNELPYNDSLTVELEENEIRDQEGNVTGRKIKFVDKNDSSLPYDIKRQDSEKSVLSRNYEVTLMNSKDDWGTCTVSSLEVYKFDDPSGAVERVEDEDGIPVFEATYDGNEHCVYVYGKLSAGELIDDEEISVYYEQHNESDYNKPELFTDAGVYTVNYSIDVRTSSREEIIEDNAGNQKYTTLSGKYILRIKPQELNITVKDQTYQYDNTGDGKHFRDNKSEYEDEEVDACKSELVEIENGLLNDHHIVSLKLTKDCKDIEALNNEVTGKITVNSEDIVIKECIAGNDPAPDAENLTKNYDIKVTDGTFTVEKATIEVGDIDDITKEYNGTELSEECYTSSDITAIYKTPNDTDIDKGQVIYHYLQIFGNEEADLTNPDTSITSADDRFDEKLLDVINAGSSRVYYYVSAYGYEPSEVKSFKLDISQKPVTITLKNQDEGIVYPADVNTDFSCTFEATGGGAEDGESTAANATKDLANVTISGILANHTISGSISKTKDDNHKPYEYDESTTTDNQLASVEEPDIFEKGTLSCTASNLNVIDDNDNNNVTKNYSFTFNNNNTTYTIKKAVFDYGSIRPVACSNKTYDAALHPAVSQFTPKEFANEANEAITYMLFAKDKYTGNTLENEGATIDAIRAEVIKNVNESQKEWSAEIPQIRDAGEYVLVYKVHKDGYKDYYNRVKASIRPADLALYVQNQEAGINTVVLKEEITDEYKELKQVIVDGLMGDDKISSIAYDYVKPHSGSNDFRESNIDVKQVDGKHVLTISNNGQEVALSNYNITSYPGLWTVKRDEFKIIVTSKDSATYNGSEHSYDELLNITINGKTYAQAKNEYPSLSFKIYDENWQNEVDIESFRMTTPGTQNIQYKVSALGFKEYSSLEAVPVTVDKATITITARNQTYTYGDKDESNEDKAFDQKAYDIEKPEFMKGLNHTVNDTNFMLYCDPFDSTGYGTEEIKQKGSIKVYDNSNADDASTGTDVTQYYKFEYISGNYTVNPLSFATEGNDNNNPLKIIVNNKESSTSYYAIDITPDDTYNAAYYNVSVGMQDADSLPAGYKVIYKVNDEVEARDSLSFIDAGTYKITATVSATGYETSTVEFTYVINKADVTIQLANQNVQYGDSIKQQSEPVGNISFDDNNEIFAQVSGLKNADTILIKSITKESSTDENNNAINTLTFVNDYNDENYNSDTANVVVNYADTNCKAKNYNIKISPTKAILTDVRRTLKVKLKSRTIKDAYKDSESLSWYDNTSGVFGIRNYNNNNSERLADYIDVEGLRDKDYIQEVTFNVSSGEENIVIERNDFSYTVKPAVCQITICAPDGSVVTQNYDYEDSMVSASSFTIKSMPINISGGTYTYDGNPHGAVITSADDEFNITDDIMKSVKYQLLEADTDVTELSGGVTDVQLDNSNNPKTVKVKVTVPETDEYAAKTEIVDIKINKRTLSIKANDMTSSITSGESVYTQTGSATKEEDKDPTVVKGTLSGTEDAAETDIANVYNLVKGQSISGIKLTADTTKAGQKDITVNTNDVTITSADGTTDVTNNYYINTTSGNMDVNTIPIAIYVNNEKVKVVTDPYEGTYGSVFPISSVEARLADGTTATGANITFTYNKQSYTDLESLISVIKGDSDNVKTGQYSITIEASNTDKYKTVRANIKLDIKPAKAVISSPAVLDGGYPIGDAQYGLPYEGSDSPKTCTVSGITVSSNNQKLEEHQYTPQFALNDSAGTYSDSFTLTEPGTYTVYYKVNMTDPNYEYTDAPQSFKVIYCDHKDTAFSADNNNNNNYTCATCGKNVEFKYGVNAYVIEADNDNMIKVSDANSTENKLGDVKETYAPNEKVALLTKNAYKKTTNIFLGWYKLEDIKNAAQSNEEEQQVEKINITSLKPVSTAMDWTYKASLDKNQSEGVTDKGSDNYVAVYKDTTIYLTINILDAEPDGKLENNIATVMKNVDGKKADDGGYTYDALDSNDYRLVNIGGVSKSLPNLKLGTRVKVSAPEKVTVDNTNYKFVQWADELGAKVSTDNEYEFVLKLNTNIRPVYAEEGKVTVTTYTKYNQPISTQRIAVGQANAEDIQIGTAPLITDYVFAGWQLEHVKVGVVQPLHNSVEFMLALKEGDEGYADVAAANTAVKAKIVEWINDNADKASNANADSEIKIIPIYKLVEKPEFAINVTKGTVTHCNGDRLESPSAEYKIKEKSSITVTAETPVEGYRFDHWELINSDNTRKIVSYNEVYAFYASEATWLEAVFVEEAEDVVAEARAVTDISKFVLTKGYAEGKNRLSFTSTSTVPEGYEIENAGVNVWIRKADDNGNIPSWSTDDPVDRVRGSASTSATFNYTYNLTVSNTANYDIYIQSFVICVNENGDRIEEYGKCYRINTKDASGQDSPQLEEAVKP